MLHALLTTEDREAVELLSGLVRSSEQITLERTFCPPPTTYQLTMALNTLSLDVAFVDVSSWNAAALCEQIRGREKPAAIVGFSMETLARTCPHSLTPFTLNFPLSVPDLLETVRAAIRSIRPNPYRNLSVFVPSKAGAGASTTVINVAAHLAAARPRRVLVAECDLRSGTMSEHLNLRPQQSIGQTLSCADSAEALIWPRHISTSNGVDFLLTDRDHEARRPEWHSYYHLLAFVASRYEHILLDLPELVNDATAEAVRSANRVYLVTTPDILALHLARQRLRELNAVGVEAAKIGVILNREQSEGLGRAAVSEFLGCEVVCGFPSDDRAVIRAMLQNSAVDARTTLGRAYASFARLIGEGAAIHPWPVQHHKRTLWDLLGRTPHGPNPAAEPRRAVLSRAG